MADSLAPTGDAEKDKRAMKRLEEEIARMKKNQERRLHRKNAKIVKEGGTPMQLNRPIKPDTTRRCGHCGQIGHMSEWFGVRGMRVVLMDVCRNEPQVPEVGRVQQCDAADACTDAGEQQCGTGERDEPAATRWYGLQPRSCVWLPCRCAFAACD